MDPFTIASLITSGASLFGKIASQGRESSIRRARMRLLPQLIEAQRKKELAEGTGQILKLTSGLRSQAGARSERIARSQGREGEAESYRIPSEGRVARAGTQALSDFTLGTNRAFDRAQLDVAMGNAEEPIEPGFGDYLGSIADTASKYIASKQLLQPQETELAKREAQATPQISDDVLAGGAIERPIIGQYGGDVYDPSGLDFFKRYQKDPMSVVPEDPFRSFRNRQRRRMLGAE